MTLDIHTIEARLRQHIARTRMPCATRLHLAILLGMQLSEWEACLATGIIPYEQIIKFALAECINLNGLFLPEPENEGDIS